MITMEYKFESHLTVWFYLINAFVALGGSEKMALKLFANKIILNTRVIVDGKPGAWSGINLRMVLTK